jgi:hypothetical protein
MTPKSKSKVEGESKVKVKGSSRFLHCAFALRREPSGRNDTEKQKQGRRREQGQRQQQISPLRVRAEARTLRSK